MADSEENLIDIPIKWGEKTLEAIQQLIEENKNYYLQQYVKPDHNEAVQKVS